MKYLEIYCNIKYKTWIFYTHHHNSSEFEVKKETALQNQLYASVFFFFFFYNIINVARQGFLQSQILKYL